MTMSLLLLIAAASHLAAGQPAAACTVFGRRGTCQTETVCGLSAGFRAYDLAQPGVVGDACADPAAGETLACCAPAIYGACQIAAPFAASGVATNGECRHVDTCASPLTAYPESSSLVTGCDTALEADGIMCCIDATAALAARDSAVVVTDEPAAIVDASGPPCTAYGVRGSCLDKRSCPRGTTAQPYRRGLVEGCLNQPSNVQCCSSGSAPALPAGKTCVGYGRVGTCLLKSRCASPYTAHVYRRGYVEGCENEADNIQCCSTGIAPVDALPPIRGTAPRAGTITACQTAALLQRAGVSSTYVHKLVCTAKYESTFNCNSQNLGNTDGTGDYGLFQANSRYWCGGGRGRNSGNGCRVQCLSLVGNCEEAARCAATILRTHNGGPPRSMNAWVAYTSHRAECDRYRVPPSCGVSLLTDEDGNNIEVFTGEELVGEMVPNNGTTSDNSLAIGLGVGIPIAVICLVAVIAAAVIATRRRSFDVESAVTQASDISMQSARSGRTGEYACAQCGKSYPTAADLAHHMTIRHA